MAETASNDGGSYTRGALSKRTGCNIETIRYYESIGLLADPPRTRAGHRVYSQDHLRRLTFVRRCRQLGFSLREIRSLLRLIEGGESACAEVHALTLDHVADVQRKIADLRRMERVLSDMAAQCRQDEIPDCPIIDNLFEENPHREL